LKEGFEVEIFLFLATDFTDYADFFSHKKAQKGQEKIRRRLTRIFRIGLTGKEKGLGAISSQPFWV